jgi:cyclohexanecarboxylate-CoA ligase
MQGRQTDWGIQLDAARATAMRRSGAWHDKVLTEFFQPHAAAHPERTAIVAARGDTGEITRVTYAQLAGAADKIALGLHALGIQRGISSLSNCRTGGNSWRSSLAASGSGP